MQGNQIPWQVFFDIPLISIQETFIQQCVSGAKSQAFKNIKEHSYNHVLPVPSSGPGVCVLRQIY